jgi:hypothetical protein
MEASAKLDNHICPLRRDRGDDQSTIAIEKKEPEIHPLPISHVEEGQKTIVKKRTIALLLSRQEAIAITINAITNSQKRFLFHVGLSATGPRKSP